MNTESGGSSFMPKGVGNYYVFQVFNMMALGMVTGAPMLLFFKEMHASDTVLGMVAAVPMLLFTLQIPAAKHVERIGYRKFVLRGWILRPVFIFGMIVVAFLPSMENSLRIALMFFLIFALGMARSIATAGIMPWMCELVPESIRGRYVSGDQMSIALAGITCSMLNAFIFSQLTAPIGFRILFVGGCLFSVISLFFLWRIPDVPSAHVVRNPNPVPWRKIIFFPPFFRIVVFSVFMYLAIGASSVFWVPFFRESLHVSKSMVLIFGAIESVSSFLTFYLFGKMVDRMGSKPILCISCALYAVFYVGWSAMAAGVYPSFLSLIIIQQVISGASGALYSLASIRLMMGTVPALGRSHFFAFFMVANYITAGIIPIVWGSILDSLRGWHLPLLGWEWNKYSFLYAVLAAIAILGQFVLRAVEEPRAMKARHFFREMFGTWVHSLLRHKRTGI